ncbi:hypothetical protein CPC08DRAFT_816213 [Agrocybe pediades]|nr:hypothetical protein CPC08DRAFT_816213 [Agrocybe pediades]
MPSNTSKGGKSSDYVTRGLKATIHNANTSDEAKESAAERLRQMGQEVPADYVSHPKTQGTVEPAGVDEEFDEEDEEPVSELRSGGSRRPKADVEEVDYVEDTIDDEVDESHSRGLARGATNNTMGGYKATLKNPKVSKKAKAHAQAVLDEAYAEDDA